jgi:serine O-acetyltransferase
MIQSRADLSEFVAADLRAAGLHHWRVQYRITRRVSYFTWLLRRVEYWQNCRRDPVGRVVLVVLKLRWHRLGEQLGFTIPPNVFGPGLSLAHYGTIVVHSRAKVGRECRIHQGVTIGEGFGGGVPSIGDGVNISPNAVISGGIRIGDGVGVWANSVVTRDVPDGFCVAGVNKIWPHQAL